MKSLLDRAALNLFGFSLLAVTLCVVIPFFLAIATFGMASTGVIALGNRWGERRGGHRRVRERDKLFLTSSAKRVGHDKDSVAEKLS